MNLAEHLASLAAERAQEKAIEARQRADAHEANWERYARAQTQRFLECVGLPAGPEALDDAVATYQPEHDRMRVDLDGIVLIHTRHDNRFSQAGTTLLERTCPRCGYVELLPFQPFPYGPGEALALPFQPHEVASKIVGPWCDGENALPAPPIPVPRQRYRVIRSAGNSLFFETLDTLDDEYSWEWKLDSYGGIVVLARLNNADNEPF